MAEERRLPRIGEIMGAAQSPRPLQSGAFDRFQRMIDASQGGPGLCFLMTTVGNVWRAGRLTDSEFNTLTNQISQKRAEFFSKSRITRR